MARITYHDVTGLVGDSFLAYLVYAQGRDMADLLILNPLQSFAGCDLTKNNELSKLLRADLDPILRYTTRTRCRPTGGNGATGSGTVRRHTRAPEARNW